MEQQKQKLERAEDATLLSLKMEEGTMSQGVQFLKAEKTTTKKRILP